MRIVQLIVKRRATVALLERRQALSQLYELLDRAGSGHGRLLFIGGEAGVGKSVLIRQFSDSVSRTARLLPGACDPLSTPRLLGPFHDIDAQTGGELALALADASDRPTLFSAALAALSAVRRPTVAIVEDAHWADEATLDLLRYLGRRIESTGSLLLITYRDDEIGPSHPLRRLLGDSPPSRTSAGWPCSRAHPGRQERRGRTGISGC
jgi:predicted ATPase